MKIPVEVSEIIIQSAPDYSCQHTQQRKITTGVKDDTFIRRDAFAGGYFISYFSESGVVNMGQEIGHFTRK
jgi:hypothetical protein